MRAHFWKSLFLRGLLWHSTATGDGRLYLKFGIAALQVVHVTAQLQVLSFHTLLGQQVLPLKHQQLIHTVQNSDYIQLSLCLFTSGFFI